MWIVNEDLQSLEDLHQRLNQSHNVPSKGEWTTLSVSIPRDFEPLWTETMNAYKIILETNSLSWAFQMAMIEARNSIPQEFWSTYGENQRAREKEPTTIDQG